MSRNGNEQLLTNFSPPLPPKLHQSAPPIPPKLVSDHKIIPEDCQLKNRTKTKTHIKIRPKHQIIAQNEGYRFIDRSKVEDLDFVENNDSTLIYENRNTVLSVVTTNKSIDEQKPKSLIRRMKSLFTKRKSIKTESKAIQNNEYFSSHKSETSVLPSRNHLLSEISNDSCSCSEFKKSWYAMRQPDCFCRGFNNSQFHVPRPQHCHFNCIPMCQIQNQCHRYQLEHFQRNDSLFNNMQSIKRCVNCHPCLCNTHCNSQVPSFGHLSSFNKSSKSSQFNHDRQSLENTEIEPIELNTESKFDIPTASLMTSNKIFSQETNALTMSLHENLQLLRKVGWYWGPLKSDEAEELMTDRCDGTFIVRDSSHADYLFSITFRVNNCTHHTRIIFSQSRFCLIQDGDNDGFKTVIDLINATVRESMDGKFRFFQTIENLLLPTYAVILLYPLSRFRIMSSLKHIARFVIVSHVRSDHLDQLPLPEYLVSYLQDKDHHYVENIFNYVNIMRASDRPAFS